MKKSVKLLAVLATIASLTACENLGEKVDYNEGIKQQAHYEKNVETYMPNVYSYNKNITMKISVSNTSVATKTKGVMGFDMDKLFYYVSADVSATVKQGGQSGSATATQNVYVYYKDGALYDVFDTNNGGVTKNYVKTTMTQAEAKKYILDNYLINYSSISNTVDGTSAQAITGSEADLVKYYKNYYIASECSFYSKGEGNLSMKTAMNYSTTSSGVRLSFKFKMTGTFENGWLTKMSISGKGTGTQGISATFSASQSGSAKCTVKYPNLAGYSQISSR